MLRVLLVDDEIVSVNALKRRVDWQKYHVERVFTAGSMEQAQEVFRAETVDFMLCDIEMPGGSGLDLFEWVKIYYPRTECVYITCHPEYEYMREAMKLGSADYVLKPIRYDELDEVLVRLTERIERGRRVETIPENIIMQLAETESREKHDERVHKAKRYILEHIQEDIYVEEIAEEVALGGQYLMRLFKKETGVSILEYITNERLALAKKLLAETDYPINQVADSVGYGNYSYFTRIFKNREGVNPSQYRKNMRGGD